MRLTSTDVDMWDIPHDPIGCIRLAAMFYVVPIATDVETIVYMGLRAILGCSTGSSRPCILVELVHALCQDPLLRALSIPV
eukprot:6206871-Pleurochrysis_carterae.AAC.2